MNAPSGRPEAMPLARHTMSGSTPVCSTASSLPVRPMPDWTSSATSRIPCLSVSSRRRGMKSSGGTRYPPSPWIGSTKTAATLSGGATVAKSSSIRAIDSSVLTPRAADGKGAWNTDESRGAKRRRWLAFEAVSESAPYVRPWKPPMNAM